MMKIGTSGFRGIIGEQFTKENVQKIVQSISEYMIENNLKKEVIIGYDNRFMSEIYAKWICEVLAGNNIKSFLMKNSVSSPIVSFATKEKNNDFGIMITASHNPYFYNGLKIYTKDGKEPCEELESYLNSKPSNIKKINIIDFEKALSQNLIIYFDYTKQYVNSIIKLIKFKSKFNKRIAFNVMNGSSLNSVIELKNKLNLKNLVIYNEKRDVSFNFNAPNPFVPEFIKDFKKDIAKKKFDFAFATDGDGDRIAVYDEKGEYHDGNEIASLLYYFALSQKKEVGPFVKNFSFSSLIDKIANSFNQKIFETKIGFKHISAKLEETNALFGAENSGCEVKGHVFVKDGLVVFALLLEIIEFYKKPIGKLFKDLKQKFGYNNFYQEISFENHNRSAVEKFLNNNKIIFRKKTKKIDNLDGFKYIFEDDTWILIRYSGNEDMLRITLEQDSIKNLKELTNQAKQIIENIK